MDFFQKKQLNIIEVDGTRKELIYVMFAKLKKKILMGIFKFGAITIVLNCVHFPKFLRHGLDIVICFHRSRIFLRTSRLEQGKMRNYLVRLGYAKELGDF